MKVLRIIIYAPGMVGKLFTSGAATTSTFLLAKNSAL